MASQVSELDDLQATDSTSQAAQENHAQDSPQVQPVLAVSSAVTSDAIPISDSKDGSSEDDTVKSKPHPAEQDTSTRPRPVPDLQSSSKLAAAIVNSAPLHRRQVFLQPSNSFEYVTGGTSSGPAKFSKESALKRRSWHVERVTARMLSVLGESESALSELPGFNRSYSNEVEGGARDLGIHVCTCIRTYGWFVDNGIMQDQYVVQYKNIE